MDKKLSYYSLKPHLQNLRISGYFQLDPNSPKLHKFYHNIYMRIIFILILLYFMQQILKVYEVKCFNLNFIFRCNTMCIGVCLWKIETYCLVLKWLPFRCATIWTKLCKQCFFYYRIQTQFTNKLFFWWKLTK